MLFNKTSYGNKGSFKYYIGYMHELEGLLPLCITLPQSIGHTKCFNDNKKHIVF